MKDEYLLTMGPITQYLHRPCFRRLWEEPTREGEWCGRFQLTQSFAFQFAVLYHATGRVRFLRLARRYLLDFDQGYHFAALFVASAYRLIARHLTRAERLDFGQRWTTDAVKALDRYVGAEGQDWAGWDGVHNHALCACVYADLARRLFPRAAEPHHFERRTDAVWRIFWARRDFYEQASNYEGFALCFLAEWAALRGVEREFYRTPSIQNMLDRLLLIVTPAGVVVPYGDSAYTEHASAYAALFERVANRAGSAEHKRAAMDLFGNLRRYDLMRMARGAEKALRHNIYNGRVLFGQFLHMISYLGLAALWANPAVRPAARRRDSGVIRRLPPGYRLRPPDLRRLPAPKMVDCQLAMTGGPEEPGRRTYLLLSVGPAYWHDHADASAILSLCRGRTVLLGTQSYLQRPLLYHNAFYVQPASAGAAYPQEDPGSILELEPRTAGRIEAFECDRSRSYARVRFDRFGGFPVTVIREVTIDAAGGVTLSDRALAEGAGFRGGPLFHAQHILDAGVGAWRLRTDALGAMCIVESPNPPGVLRIELLTPGAEGRCFRPRMPAIYNVSGYRKFPCCHYRQIWKQSYVSRQCLAVQRPLVPGREEVFALRLTPEEAGER